MANKNNIKVFLKSIIGNFYDFSERDILKRKTLNKLSDIRSVREKESPIILGIIYDRYQLHTHYVKAALELKISFDVIKLHKNQWFEDVTKINYDGFIAWPNGMKESLKSVYDSRLKIIEDVLKKPIFPDYLSIWLFENKIRSFDWLTANKFSIIPTFVFYSQKEAIDSIDKIKLPVIIKTNLGASGKGVYIVKSKQKYKSIIKKCFKSGIKNAGTVYAETRGYAYVQKFIPDMEEWRMVRIGDSFFGHQKIIGTNEKHSGTLKKGWKNPTHEMLNLLREVTEKGNFRSMNVDMFRTKKGKLFINELHTVFGQSTKELMRVDGVPGRYLFNDNKWVFEKGNFVEGHSAKARIQYFINSLK